MSDFKTVQVGSPTYNHVAGAGTAIVKTGAGCLHGIVVGAPGGTCTVYDNAAGSGTVMAVIDLSTVTVPTSLPFNCDFTTGLTLVTTSTSDITAVFE